MHPLPKMTINCMYYKHVLIKIKILKMNLQCKQYHSAKNILDKWRIYIPYTVKS